MEYNRHSYEIMPLYPIRGFPAVLSALVVLSLFLSAEADADPNIVAETFQPYAELLGQFVTEHDLPDDGLVSSFDYRSALEHAETSDRLAEQRQRLAEFDPDVLTDRDSANAFWLNAYNFFMIAHILENPRRGELVSSVRDYGHLFNPYRVFRRDLFDVGGRKYSLSEIELDILLGTEFQERGWKDARVHFTVNCASVGCPPLRADIHTADNVEYLMAENTRRSLNTSLHLWIDNEVLYLSSLFDWYEDDYVEHSGSVREFLNDYADPDLRPAIEATQRIRFIDYDWDLNSPENMQPWIR